MYSSRVQHSGYFFHYLARSHQVDHVATNSHGVCKNLKDRADPLYIIFECNTRVPLYLFRGFSKSIYLIKFVHLWKCHQYRSPNWYFSSNRFKKWKIENKHVLSFIFFHLINDCISIRLGLYFASGFVFVVVVVVGKIYNM